MCEYVSLTATIDACPVLIIDIIIMCFIQTDGKQ